MKLTALGVIVAATGLARAEWDRDQDTERKKYSWPPAMKQYVDDQREWQWSLKGNPTINYSARLFTGPNCTGEDASETPYDNFQCSDICFPAMKARSVLLDATHYDRKPQGTTDTAWDRYTKKNFRYDMEHDVTFIPYLLEYKLVQTEGPMVEAFTAGDCLAENKFDRAAIPKDNAWACYTFDKAATGVHLKLLKLCDRDWDDRFDPAKMPHQPEVVDFSDAHVDAYERYVNEVFEGGEGHWEG